MDSKKDYWDEEWKDLVVEDMAETEKFKISNYGRIKSFKVNPDGVIIKGSEIGGYKSLTIRRNNGKTTSKYIHKLTAEHFVPKTSDEEKYVLHKDYAKKNNYFPNLVWATKRDKEVHLNKNPNFIATKKMVKNAKLTEAKVKLLKKKIFDPNRKTRLKMLAKQFGISEMQLYRIKSGENWGHVTMDD